MLYVLNKVVLAYGKLIDLLLVAEKLQEGNLVIVGDQRDLAEVVGKLLLCEWFRGRGRRLWIHFALYRGRAAYRDSSLFITVPPDKRLKVYTHPR